MDHKGLSKQVEINVAKRMVPFWAPIYSCRKVCLETLHLGPTVPSVVIAGTQGNETFCGM